MPCGWPAPVQLHACTGNSGAVVVVSRASRGYALSPQPKKALAPGITPSPCLLSTPLLLLPMPPQQKPEMIFPEDCVNAHVNCESWAKSGKWPGRWHVLMASHEPLAIHVKVLQPMCSPGISPFLCWTASRRSAS